MSIIVSKIIAISFNCFCIDQRGNFLTITDRLIFSFQLLQHASVFWNQLIWKTSLEMFGIYYSCMLSITVAINCSLTVDSQRIRPKFPPALGTTMRQGKQKAALELTQHFNQFHLRYQEALKHLRSAPNIFTIIGMQPHLLWTVNSQTTRIKFLFDRKPTCTSCY